MNPLLIIGLVVGGLILAGAFVTVSALMKARPGYQDERGFHEIPKK